VFDFTLSDNVFDFTLSDNVFDFTLSDNFQYQRQFADTDNITW